MPDQAKPLPKPGMDPTAAPPWWLTKPKEIRAFLESLDGVKVEEIGHTAGGRPVIAAAWGEREDLPGRTSKSLASALSGGDAAAFYGKGERSRQAILFVGNAHGTEWDGTVAALHYLNILVTGRDLLGREWPKLAETGRRHRFVLIPVLNVDGRERALDHVHWINVTPDYMMMISQGLTRDGVVLQWPSAKLTCPIPPDSVKILGTYYNDAGMNLVYDAPFGPECQPETDALLRLCRREMPDAIVLSHSNNGSLVDAPSAFIPSHYKQKVHQLAACVGMRCYKDGFPKREIPRRPTFYAGEVFYQSDAVYHACGALPLTVEFPCGWQNLPDSHRGILDIGLAVLDEIALFGAAYRFRPRDPVVKL